mmetsp:Transcript_40201/g.93443  ORF Transcript_40201/g.93443 Transcript_40201/m.93443 type:complete len:106 (-) Transcript_40201:61-378(-)
MALGDQSSSAPSGEEAMHLRMGQCGVEQLGALFKAMLRPLGQPEQRRSRLMRGWCPLMRVTAHLSFSNLTRVLRAPREADSSSSSGRCGTGSLPQATRLDTTLSF